MKDDFFGLVRAMPKMVCNFLRGAGAFAVLGLGVESFGIGIPDADGGRCLARGVVGVMVALVAVVVDDSGRDGMRVTGFEGPDCPMLSDRVWPLCDGGRPGIGSLRSTGGGVSRPVRERERDRERVSDRVMKR